MGVFHVFKIVHKVLNRATHHTSENPRLSLNHSVLDVKFDEDH